MTFTRQTGRPRLVIRALLLLAMAGLAAMAPATVAGAHAEVVSTDPADGARVPADNVPDAVTVTFSEGVSTDLGDLQVLDEAGNPVDDGVITQPSSQIISVGIPSDLGEGTYIGSYRVVSADGHTISGAWVFAVGEATSLDVDTSDITPRASSTWERLDDLARFVLYLGTLLAAGGIVFLAFIVDDAPGSNRLFGIIEAAVMAGLAGMAGWVVTQSAVTTGRGLEAATDLEVLSTVLRETLGWTMLCLAGGMCAISIAARVRRLSITQTVGFYGAVAVVIGYVFWGHATELDRRWLAIGSNLTHAATAAIWFGGLAMLARLLWLRGRMLGKLEAASAAPTSDEALPDGPPLVDPTTPNEGNSPAPAAVSTLVGQGGSDAATLVAETGETVARFSRLAAVTVVLLWMAGLTLAWLATGSLEAMTGSTYGRLVIAKGVIVVMVLGLAAWNRQVLVPAIALDAVEADEHPDDPVAVTEVLARWGRLRRTVWAEAGALVVVVALTSVLVNTPPGKAATAESVPSVPYQSLVPLGDTVNQLQIDVVPATTGDNKIHISYYGPDGRAVDEVQEATLEFALPDKGISPITRQAVKAGPGHYTWEGSDLSIAATWTVTVRSRVSEFEEIATTFSVPVTAS